MDLFGTEYGFCAQTAGLWQLVGYLILIAKIVIPVSLIISGIIILGKTVISSDEKENKDEYKKLTRCIVAGIMVFFIPYIISAMFGVVNGFNDLKPDYNVCKRCMTHPNSEYCNDKVLAIEYND
ncbi:MAG: hypothetical protein IKR74_05410 [Bacilli bacterium]|nr:hypothetical protein [Bacilli bacterium]